MHDIWPKVIPDMFLFIIEVYIWMKPGIELKVKLWPLFLKKEGLVLFI